MTRVEQAQRIDQLERYEAHWDFIQRALAYAKQKRAEERAKVLGTVIRHRETPVVLWQPAPTKTAEPKGTRSKSAFANNGRRAALHEINGERKTIAAWCNAYGADEQSVRRRLRLGTPLEVALALKPGERALKTLETVVSTEGAGMVETFKVAALTGESSSLQEHPELGSFYISQTELNNVHHA